MKNQELFDRTISVLVNAYINDTLEKLNCKACAVGNLVASGMGHKIVKSGLFGFDWIGNEEFYEKNGVLKFPHAEWMRGVCYSQEVKNAQIASTGYTADFLLEIERRFMGPYCYGKYELSNYGGLMCVVDGLIEYHGGNDEEKEAAKSMFQPACV